MTKVRSRGITRSKWFLPSFSLVLGLVILAVTWLVAIARGQSGNPYGWLLAVGGLAYLLAVAWFRWRG
jgi:predicted membrane channel-forming protein YqfA (hemolysin III family)